MDIIDLSLIFVVIVCIVMVVSSVPFPGWIKAIGYFALTIAPSWYAWATDLWPFYIWSAVMLTTLVLVIAYNLGKAFADANDRP